VIELEVFDREQKTERIDGDAADSQLGAKRFIDLAGGKLVDNPGCQQEADE
jgi:hypothetical protein